MQNQTKIQDLLPQLGFLEIASVIHCASEALRHSCGFARAFADLGVRIDLIYDHVEDDGWMLESVQDIQDTKELVNLITAASFRLQTLSK